MKLSYKSSKGHDFSVLIFKAPALYYCAYILKYSWSPLYPNRCDKDMEDSKP